VLPCCRAAVLPRCRAAELLPSVWWCGGVVVAISSSGTATRQHERK